MMEPVAKGGADGISLKRHSSEVLSLVSEMLDALKPYIDPFTAASVRRAAIYHDLGKAARGMQEALLCGKRWGYRHEVLSAAILLATGMADHYPLAISAILTHHKSLNDPRGILQDCVGINVTAEDEHRFKAEWRRRTAELTQHWRWIKEFIRRSDPNCGEAMLSNLPDSPETLPDLRSFFISLEEQLRSDDVSGLGTRGIPYIISRGLLMAADHLASSGIKFPIVKLLPKPMRLRNFQERVGGFMGSAILEAPTGSGKTHAAIAWALRNRQAGERIFYVLPYQASINAMAHTLSGENGFGFGKEAVGLIHHNALMYEFRQHFDEESDNYAEAENAARQRVDQSRQFYRPIKILTPYQILKLLFGCKRFEIGLAEMLGGLIIFDEIHAYEPHVAALIEVALSRLQSLGVRYLFMTATFPDFLKERLASCVPGLVQFGIDGKDAWEKKLLSRARHKLNMHARQLEDMVPEIVEAARYGSVLVACNRIEQAKTLFEKIREDVDSTSLLHGGFNASDRLRKERSLFGRVGSLKPVCKVLVATQVVEVSLDISFDTIFTELAPVDDLLQRFGRVNRVYEWNRPVDVHVATVFDEEKLLWVYDPERLRKTMETAPDGEELLPEVESRWVRAVYAEGYLPKEQEKFERALCAFGEVIRRLRPLHDGSDQEFYELFNSIPVLPAELLQPYEQALLNKRYLIAAQMMISLPMSTFKRFERDGALESIVPEGSESRLWVVKLHYDPDVGLTNDPATLPATII